MSIASSARRRICIATGSRAEYGLLRPLMRQIAADPELHLQIIATGMHLSPEFGLTLHDILADGFSVDEKVEMLLSSDSRVGVAKSIGVGVIGFADALGRLKPDILVVLGDRFEMLAAAQVALVAGIPIAHIHGGEVSEGSFDDSIRHCITKMAHWHFVAAEPYRARVVQLGENPDRVFNFGAPGLDQLGEMEWIEQRALEDFLGMLLKAPVFLVTYHPSTGVGAAPAIAIGELLAALDAFPAATVVFTYPNADPSSRGIIERIHAWVAKNEQRARVFVSLGTRRYLSLMRRADVVVGNSSSGLIEAPALRKATVNIGDRQRGRLKAASVIDAPENAAAIASCIARALSPEFRSVLQEVESPYGTGRASFRIKEVLKRADLQAAKSFFDIQHEH